MTRSLLIAVLFPMIVFAQAKSKAKETTAVKAVTEADGFTITGEVTGFADGTKIALLNGQTGAPELQTTIEKNAFTFKGKVDNPSFKIILADNKPPYITLFLDNSNVKISGYKEALDRSIVSGSASHADFEKFNTMLAPYQQLFGENAAVDPTAAEKAKQAIQSFIRQNSSSFISPLAVLRFMQLSPDDISVTEELFNGLKPQVRASDIGNYLTQQIAEAKVNGIGTEMEDFTQNDTDGKPFKLSSLRGKYVLVDFWASWCRPCRQENPNVVANYNKYKSKNFTVLGVSLDKAKPAWVEAINMDGLTWTHVSDLQGWSNAVAQQFRITSIPQNFLVGPDGKIIAKNLRGAALDHKLEQLLK